MKPNIGQAIPKKIVELLNIRILHGLLKADGARYAVHFLLEGRKLLMIPLSLPVKRHLIRKLIQLLLHAQKAG